MLSPEIGARATSQLLMPVVVCFVCSVVVATTAVLLRPRQEANRAADRASRLQAILASQPGLAELFRSVGSAAVEARVIELESGAFADWIDPNTFDPVRAAEDTLERVQIPAALDLAGLGARARYALVHLVRGPERIELVILPVRGPGYVSTISGYLALSVDGNRVRGLTFYEHEETPGLGGEIEDPAWLSSWLDKRVYDEAGNVRLGVAEPGSGTTEFLVDGLSGATLTGEGVTHALRYWLGDHGFGPFLKRLAE